MTDFQCYLKLDWASETDECENACGVIMAEDRYVLGALGHYCSEDCRDDAED